MRSARTDLSPPKLGRSCAPVRIPVRSFPSPWGSGRRVSRCPAPVSLSAVRALFLSLVSVARWPASIYLPVRARVRQRAKPLSPAAPAIRRATDVCYTSVLGHAQHNAEMICLELPFTCGGTPVLRHALPA